MPLSIFTERSILDVWLGYKNATKSFNKSFCAFNYFSFSLHLVKYFLLLLHKFSFLLILKKNLQVLLYKSFIFIRNENICKKIHKYEWLWCLIISKEIFIIFIWRRLNIVKFFILAVFTLSTKAYKS